MFSPNVIELVNNCQTIDGCTNMIRNKITNRIHTQVMIEGMVRNHIREDFKIQSDITVILF